MSNVMSLKSFSNDVKRNGFDLSFKNAFTAKAGELLPVFCKEVIPGDKFKIKGQAFARTQPLMSAAYVRMREYYDFFFVPYKLLWNRALTFFTNLPDYHQAANISTPVEVGDQHPYFTDADVFNYLNRVNSDEVGKNNLFGYSRAELSIKLLDALGYGQFSLGGSYVGNNLVLNPFPLFAYQKVCQDFFRDDQWEKAAPYKYNVDYITSASDLHIPINGISISDYNMFDMNYCNYPKDYFMGMLPSAQYGEEAFVALNFDGNAILSSGSDLFGALDVQDVSLYRQNGLQSGWTKSFAGSQGLNAQADGIYADADHTVRLNQLGGNISSNNASFSTKFDVGINTTNVTSKLSILALRQAEALQKWKEIAQSGRQDYQTQMQKHFNVNPSDAMSNHCKYLGGWTSNLDINEVLNTNLTDPDTSQADIYGKGTSASTGVVDFDSKEHGILIGIYHCIPLLDYGVQSIHKFNMKSHFTDYAIPEFDCIGMQQLSPYELLTDAFGVDEFPQLGWVPRYADYKTSFDEVHGEFNKTLTYWVARMTPDYLKTYFDAVKAKYGSYQVTYEFFKVNPSILDNLFGAHVDGTTETDQFLINSFFDTKVVRNLDYNGLPY